MCTALIISAIIQYVGHTSHYMKVKINALDSQLMAIQIQLGLAHALSIIFNLFYKIHFSSVLNKVSVTLIIVSVFQFQEQLGQGCSPEESDTFQTQGQCDKVSKFFFDLDSSCMLDVFFFVAIFFKDQRFLTRCCSALNIYQSLCHSWRYHI